MSAGPASEESDSQREQERVPTYPLLHFDDSGIGYMVSSPSFVPLTTTMSPEEQRAQWERQRQAEAAGAAEEQSGDAATEDKKVEPAEDDKAGKDAATTATAEAGTGQSDRTSGAYRLL